MKKRLFIAFLTLLCAAATFAQSGTVQIDGKACPVDTLACYQVGPGTLYTRYNVKIGSTVHHLYLLTVDLTNPYITVEEGQGREHMGSVELMTATHQRIDSAGHRPIGSVNCNFWCVSSQNTGDWEGLVNQPFAGTAKDGMLIGEPMDWNAPHGDRGYVMLDDLKRVFIRNMEFNGRLIKGTASRKIFDCNRPRVTPTNKNEICLFNRFIGTTRAIPDSCIELVFTPVQGQDWAINDTMTCVVTAINHTGRTALSGNLGALQGRGTRGTWMQNNFQLGDTFQILLGMYSANQVPGINVQLYPADYNYSGDSITPRVMQMVTGNCLVMANGDITYRNANEDYNNKNYPRTMLATNNDGNRMWLLVSEKPGNYTAEMCELLRYDGATWAAGMDGGGSAQMNLFGQVLNPTTEGSPRAVANSWFVVSTAPDDSQVATLQFVDNLPTTVSSYASYAPKLRAYNQYGWLLASDYTDFTLSCQPASLGTIAADGKTFVASAEGGEGTLTATAGSITVTKQVRVLPGDLSLRLPNVLIDNRDYPIEVFSSTEGRSYAVNPALLSWNVDDWQIAAVSKNGTLRGRTNGATTIQGTLGTAQTTMNVTVEIPAENVVESDLFTRSDSLWTLQNAYGSIEWTTPSAPSDPAGTFTFQVNSARAPQVKLTGDAALYGLPDSLALTVRSDVGIKTIAVTAQPASQSQPKVYSAAPQANADGSLTLVVRPANLGADADDIATYPIRLQSVSFTLQGASLNVPHTITLEHLRLYYHHTQPQALPEQDASPSATSSRKFLLNGQLLIEHHGTRYTPTGQRLK